MRNFIPIVVNREKFIAEQAKNAGSKLDSKIRKSLLTVVQKKTTLLIINRPIITSAIIDELNKNNFLVEEVKLHDILGINDKDRMYNAEQLIRLYVKPEFQEMIKYSVNYCLPRDFRINVKFTFDIVFTREIKLSDLNILRITNKKDGNLWGYLCPVIACYDINDLLLTIDDDMVNLDFPVVPEMRRAFSSYSSRIRTITGNSAHDDIIDWINTNTPVPPAKNRTNKQYSIRFDKNGLNFQEIISIMEVISGLLKFESVCLDTLLETKRQK